MAHIITRRGRFLKKLFGILPLVKHALFKKVPNSEAEIRKLISAKNVSYMENVSGAYYYPQRQGSGGSIRYILVSQALYLVLRGA